MRKEDREYLDRRLATLDSNERQRLFKRAAAVRQTEKDIHRRRVSRRDDDWQSGGMVPRAAASSLDDRVLALLRAEDNDRAVAVPLAQTAVGTVVWLGSKTCVVRHAAGDAECQLNAMGVIAVGDEVTLDTSATVARIAAVHARRTVLSRPDPHNARLERVIAANVDVVVIVVSVGSPPLHPRVIDRYLVAVQRGGASALICLNKIDLVAGEAARDETMAVLKPYVDNGIPTLPCSTTTGEGMRALLDHISGRMCAFVGHSGVGKSSLANALHPELAARSGEVSDAHGRGTHTTTASTLYELPGGTRVIDTPGIRSFGLWKISAEELRWYFPEFDTVLASCRFGDCTHSHEPGCAVRAAVESGLVGAARYDTYLRMLGSLRTDAG